MDTRQHVIQKRYRAIESYGRKIVTALPNARDVGLQAHAGLRKAHVQKVTRCSILLRHIEAELDGETD